ncbi:hypothetical protein C1H46_007745 [Malus baccata]|uniref:Uncharacterized protein n=1 Tax=Malus baccata TaxID=106549 RepID=A0A540N6Q2_MALBA|nr:hypothetical protein C1H46_007745 [Malus baccata]
MSFERPCCYSQHRPHRLCLSIRVLVHTLYFVEESYQLNKSSKADRQEERTTDHTMRYSTWILQICDIQINQHMDTIHSEMLLVSLTRMTVHGVCMYHLYRDVDILGTLHD